MKIWYLNHYAKAPSHGSSGRAYFLARSLGALGHEVLVVAASQHHTRPLPASADILHRVSKADGTLFYHLWARRYRGNGPGRLLNMLDYARRIPSLVRAVEEGRLERPDVIIASSAHIFAFPPALRAARAMGAKVIFEVRDIWPLSLVEIAGMAPWHPLVQWMARIERKAYRSADAVVSLLANAIEHMEPLGLDPGRFHWIPNGVWRPEWEEQIEPLPEEHRSAFARCRAAGKLIVLYAGAHGPPNALDQVLDLAAVGHGDRPYHFLFLGKGVLKESLAAQAGQRGIDFISFLPHVSRGAVRQAMNLSDACFIGWQKKHIYHYGISANKVFDYMMAGRPVVHAIETIYDPVREGRAGLSIPPYDPARLDAAIRELAAMSAEQREAMGARGREYVLRHHEWSVLGRRYEQVCQRILGSAGAEVPLSTSRE